MGLFDRFRKPKTLDKDGKPLPIVVMEEKDTIYTPAPGEVVSLDDAEKTGPVAEDAAGIVVKPTAGAIWAPQTGNVSFNAENGELTIENYLDVRVLVRLVAASDDAPLALTPLVDEDAHIHVGDPIATFDLAALNAADAHPALVVLVTNANDFAGVQPATDEPVEVGDDLLRVLRK